MAELEARAGEVGEKLESQGLQVEAQLRSADDSLLYQRMRIMMPVGAALFTLFLGLDLLVAPQLSFMLVVLRLLAVISFLGIFWALPGPFGHRHLLLLSLVGILIASEDIIAITVLMGGFRSSYYLGVALTVFTAGLFLPLPAKLMWAYSCAVLVSYLGINSWVHGVGTARELLEPSMLLLSICVLATLASELERRRRRVELELRLELESRLADRERAMRLKSQLDEREQRLAKVGEISAAIIHDLRQPLTVLTMMAESVREEVERQASNIPLNEDIATILRQVQRMRVMITEALDLARGQGELALQRREIVLCDFLKQVIEEARMLATARQVSFGSELALEGSMQGSLDVDRMHRVVDNLIRNAIEAASSRRGDEGRAEVKLLVKANEGRLRVEVWDSGSGLEEAELFGIFDALHTHGKAQGTGLGLAVARRVVEAHGGALGVVGHGPLGGALFHFEMPLQQVT